MRRTAAAVSAASSQRPWSSSSRARYGEQVVAGRARGRGPAEVEAGVDVPTRDVVAPARRAPRRRASVYTAPTRPAARPSRELEGSSSCAGRRGRAAAAGDHSARVQRRLGRRAGARARARARPGDRLVGPARRASSACARFAYATASSRPCGKRLEQRDRLARGRSASAVRPGHQRISASQRSASPSSSVSPERRRQLERRLGRRDRLGDLVGQIARSRARARAARRARSAASRRRSEAPGRTARPPRGGRRAPPPARPPRARSGEPLRGRRPPRRGARAARGRARRSAVGERGERAAVQLELASGGSDRLLDRQSRELVAERDAAPPRSAASRRRGTRRRAPPVRRERPQQPELGVGGDDGDRSSSAAPRRSAGGAREHGVADAFPARVGAGGQHLDDEERIAAGLRWSSAASTPCGRRASRPRPARGGASSCARPLRAVASSPSTIRRRPVGSSSR